VEIIMRQDKETKNSVRYSEPRKGDDPHSKNIYLTKAELQQEFGSIPESLTVNITAGG